MRGVKSSKKRKRGKRRKKYKSETDSEMTLDGRNTNRSRRWNCGSHSDRKMSE